MAGLASHCTTHRADDSIFCQLTRTATAGAAPIANAFAFASASASAPAVQAVADPRICAVVAMSPASLMFTPDSLARITVPTLLYRA